MNIIRWIGRILSVLSAAFILTFFFGEADFSQPLQLGVCDIIMLIFFPIGVTAGNILGWWKESWGALATAISLALFYLADLVLSSTWPSGPFFALLASPACFYGLYWLLSGRKPSKTKENLNAAS
ncbi:MAG: hypothetical protein JXA89_10405 [Anaerolineae bacterium]|nr:hypothetical protein [Anaerolineae bacterium]